jgi:hypothetical protein
LLIIRPAINPSLPGADACDPTGYILIHALNFVKYDVVVALDINMIVHGDLTPLVTCAQQGYVAPSPNYYRQGAMQL